MLATGTEPNLGIGNWKLAIGYSRKRRGWGYKTNKYNLKKVTTLNQDWTTMKIQVHLYGAFRSAAPSPSFSREVVEGMTVKELMESLQLPDTVYRMALVNDIRVKEGTILIDGDEVHIFQPVGGG